MTIFSEFPFTVVDQMGDTIGMLRTPEDAAMLISCLGSGYTIRHGRNIVWSEGKESQPAFESYDFVADTVYSRI